jgi:hypothetical protein
VDDRGREAGLLRGLCPACGHGTVSLTVTQDRGKHFRRQAIPKLTGFYPTGIRAVGDTVTITGKSQLMNGPRRRVVTITVHWSRGQTSRL